MRYIRSHKILILVIGVALVIGGTLIVKDYRNSSNQNKNLNPQSHTPASNIQSPSSGITDTNGQNTSPSSNPASSVNGAITLNQPTAGTKLSSSSIVSGQSTLDQVLYRIKDNYRGVIDQGSLNVVNGKFSGTLVVKSTAQNGTFEVYSFNKNTGAEENNIKINVTF